MEYRFFGSLAYPPADDDYLFQEDEYNRKRKRYYNPANDWDEDEAVERDLGDPLRLVRKSPYNCGEL